MTQAHKIRASHHAICCHTIKRVSPPRLARAIVSAHSRPVWTR
jgi:hypothetical protein